MGMKTVNLYVVEKPGILSEVSQTTLSPSDGINLLGISNNSDVSTLTQTLSALCPDVLLLSTDQLDRDTVDRLEQISADFPELGIVLLVLSYVPEDVQLLMKVVLRGGGGIAVLLKQSLCPMDRLGMIILAVSRGRVILDPTLAAIMWSGKAEVSFVGRLTARELEILNLLAKGYTNSAIAETLCIDLKTVENHLNNVYGKLKTDVDFNQKHPRVSAARLYLEATGELVTTTGARKGADSPQSSTG